ncbi:hypothetical protein F5144DRAFT_585699 [Chaetomium tenue]|uniref:Uncharacterized protein n=1 Tax=Chaetomium tenue TaxID=1854479 RepID=A0ACB7NV04_9PEZI|nr:hypothetical protein F5144DRAFT_585699 [Chaetomium globosum]
MASETAMSEQASTTATIDIAPGGDVVFIVGPTQRRLRVHSLLVKEASPVMKAMLGPNFREGHQLTKKYEETIDPVLLRDIALMLAEERNRLQMKVLTSVLDTCSYASVFFGDWAWADKVGKFKEDADGLGGRGSQGVKPTAKGNDFAFDQPARRFQNIAAWLAPKQHRTAGGLCLGCIRPGSEHKSHETAPKKWGMF